MANHEPEVAALTLTTGDLVAIASVLATIVLGACGLYWTRRQTLLSEASTPVGDEAFQRALRDKQAEFSEIVPDGHRYPIRSSIPRFEIINGDISAASAEVVVSSDDNYFSASGGVAKAILTKAGQETRIDLNNLKEFRWSQGQIAITRPGKFPARNILHPVVIDHKTNAYPTAKILETITRESLCVARAIGADSIAIPVFGGGTASKELAVESAIETIITTINDFCEGEVGTLEYVALYIFDRRQIPENYC